MRAPQQRPFRITLLLIICLVVDGWSISGQPLSLLGDQPLDTCGGTTRRTMTRPRFLQSMLVSTIGVTVGTQHQQAHADNEPTENVYQRTTTTGMKSNNNPISYQLQLPNGSSSSSSSSFQETQKPVKTHLDEVNLISDTIKGYQYAITVDPVRINSLTEFGTPEEVAARVVTAEVNRDGVFEVTLVDDPVATTITTTARSSNNNGSDGTVAYLLHYLSVGKRGNKHIWNKIIIDHQLLYVLTAQCKESDYPGLEAELKRTVASFQV